VHVPRILSYEAAPCAEGHRRASHHDLRCCYMSIEQPSPSTQASTQAARPESVAPEAALPELNERLALLLDEAAAKIRAGRTAIKRAAFYVETARRLLAGGQMPFQPLTYSRQQHLSPAPSRWFVSSRSHRRARATVPSRRYMSRRPPGPGSRLPCTRTGCSGTMEYGGNPGGRAQTAASPEAERAWVCSDRAGHAQLPHARPAAVQPTALVARARWEDDGGRTK
jgi:hypothetical protein